MKILHWTDSTLHFTVTDLRLTLGSDLHEIPRLVGNGAGLNSVMRLPLKLGLCPLHSNFLTWFSRKIM